MPNPPRKHHYLPEFYTRRWADTGGEMVRFARKPSGAIERRRVAPGGIGFQRDLYTIPEQVDGNEQALEQGLFRLVDDWGGTAVERLIQGDLPTDSDGRSRWAAFLLSLMFRRPQELRASAQAFALLATREYPDEPVSDLAANQLALHQLWKSINNAFLGGVLVQMQWDVIDFTGCGVSLMTSDSPMIMSNGIAPPSGNCALPLSPTHLFVSGWHGAERSAALAAPRKKLARLANKKIVERARLFVIANDESQRPFVEKHFGAEPVPSPIELVVGSYGNGTR